MENPTHTVGVLAYKADEILLVKHKSAAEHLNETYGLPAGRIDGSETEKQAAVREFREETGLTADERDLIELPEIYRATIERKGGRKDFTMRVYVCKRFSGDLKETGETRPEWVKISDLDRFNILPNVGRIVNDGLAYR